MDNPGYNNNEKWVEERIARLSTPAGWKPDPELAFEKIQQQHDKSGSMSRGLRLSLAGATLGFIGVVVALLPWQALWAPRTTNTTTAAKQASEGSFHESTQTESLAEPAPPSTLTHSESESEPVPASPKEPRRKKHPPYFVTAAEQTGRDIMPVKGAVPELLAREAAAPGQQPPPAGVTQPVVISQVQPGYTDEARQARIQGTIELVGTVREDGTVKVEKVTKGLGYGLDEAATAALEQWKFIPGKKDGQPVAVSLTFTMNFSLR